MRHCNDRCKDCEYEIIACGIAWCDREYCEVRDEGIQNKSSTEAEDDEGRQMEEENIYNTILGI